MANKSEESAEADALSINPKVQALVEISTDGPLAELKGFIGSSGDSEVVRLHDALSATDFVDMPKNSIRLSEHIRDDPDGKVRLLVDPSARVRRVHTDHATAGDMDQKVAGRYRLPRSTVEGTCRLLKPAIARLEATIACRCIELPYGGYLALSDEQVDYLTGQLNSAKALYAAAECASLEIFW